MFSLFKKQKESTDTTDLEKEIETLKSKLNEKQEHINKTNAYWKKKIYGLSPNKKVV